MQNWKLVLGVIGGSVLVLVLITLGLSKMQPAETVSRASGVEGDSRLVIGKVDAKVTIVEFSDFQCPACGAAQPLVEKILRENPEVKLVYRQFPLYNIHANAEAAALAAEAANAQGKFREYHDWLFANQNSWSIEKDPTAKFVDAAEKLGLDKLRFATDLKEKTYKNLVDQDVDGALKLGVDSTPTFYVNGLKAKTAELEAVVKQELSK